MAIKARRRGLRDEGPAAKHIEVIETILVAHDDEEDEQHDQEEQSVG